MFARGVGEETDIVTKEMYTFDGPRRDFAHAAAGEHRLGDPRLYRAPARPASRRAEALLHRPDVPPRAAAEGALPAVLPDRRGGHRLGIAAVDAEVIEMVVEILKGVGLSGFQAADQLGGRSPTAGRSMSSGCARSCRPWRRRCAAIASGAPRPIRCACSIARWRPTSRSSRSCRTISRLPVRRLPRALRRREAVPGRPRHRIRGAPAAGARPGLLHAHDVRSGARLARRAELGAGRRPLRRAGGIARLEGALAGHRLFDRRRPAGDERGRRPSRRPRSTCSSRRWAKPPCGTPR